MLSKLKMLLSLRAWLKSRTLNVAGVLGTIATMDVAAGTGWVQLAVDTIVSTLGVMPATAVAILFALKSVVDAFLRAKTDKALGDK